METMNYAMVINQMWGKKEGRPSLWLDWLEKYWSKGKHWWEDEFFKGSLVQSDAVSESRAALYLLGGTDPMVQMYASTKTEDKIDSSSHNENYERIVESEELEDLQRRELTISNDTARNDILLEDEGRGDKERSFCE
ncbi:hypothetical protein QQ045_006981 [Rhodiola kirilowii]